MHDLNEQDIALRNKMRETQKRYNYFRQVDLSKYIGRCFENRRFMIMVINSPQPVQTMTGEHFNEYQLPVIRINKYETNFFEILEEDTQHIKTVNEMQEIPFSKFFDTISDLMASFTCQLEQVRSAAVDVPEIPKSC